MRGSRRALLLGWALCITGCYSTETEVIDGESSTRLCGKGFSVRLDVGEPETSYAWNNGRKAYVDEKGESAVRFARFKGDVYLGQVQVLRDPDETSAARPLPEKGRYAVGFVRLAGGRLRIVLEPDCDGRGMEIESVGRGYNVKVTQDGQLPSLQGAREGILGLLSVILQCELDPVDTPLNATSVVAGGPELASRAGPYHGELFAGPQLQACDGGDLRACHLLGVRYAKGEGVTRDPRRALPLLARACDGGLPGACLDLGELYDRGDGVARDPARARALYVKACDGGEPFACERLKNP